MKAPWNREERRILKARALLTPAVDGAQDIWADLGCGDGVYTLLLCELLTRGSRIYAVDRERRALNLLEGKLLGRADNSVVTTTTADFTKALSLPPLNGIVMANSLHFVRNKKPVLRQLADLLKPGGRLVVIEYNAGRSNCAVPHPLDEHGFLRLVETAGLLNGQIVARAPSSFLGEMYTGLATRPEEG